MKNYLSRKYRVTDLIDEKGRIEFSIFNIIFLLMFVASGFAFFTSLYYICNMVGSIVCAAPYQAGAEFIRVFPMLVAFFGSLYVCNVYHKFTHPYSKESYNKLMFVSGIKFMIIGLIIFVYVLVGIGTNLYHGMIESGFSTRLFPLGIFIVGIIYISIGLAQVLFIKINKNYETNLYIRQKTIAKKGKRFWRTIGFSILHMIAGFALAALIYGDLSLDFSNNIDPTHVVAPYIISSRLMYLVPVALVLVFTFVFLPLKKEFKLEFQILFSSIMLVISVVIVVFYFVALSMYPNAPNVAAYGILVIDFTANVNAFTWLFGIANIITPLIALIKGLLAKKKLKQETITE